MAIDQPNVLAECRLAYDATLHVYTATLRWVDAETHLPIPEHLFIEARYAARNGREEWARFLACNTSLFADNVRKWHTLPECDAIRQIIGFCPIPVAIPAPATTPADATKAPGV